MEEKINLLRWIFTNIVLQLPFLIVTYWALPLCWKRIKATFNFKDKRLAQLWIDIFLFLVLKMILVFFASENPLQRFPPSPIWSFFVLACIIAPITEEFFYRYLIFEIFSKETWTPYLISFFGFITAHVGYLTFPLTFFNFCHWLISYGILTFHLIYIYRRSNWNPAFPILLHFVNNLAFFLPFIMPS